MQIRFSLYTLVVFIALVACNKPTGNLKVTGTVKHLKKGTLYIKGIKDTVLVSLDSVTLKGNNSFEFDLNLESPQMLYLTLGDKELPFFAEPGSIQIETNLNRFKREAKISGSENQKLLENYNLTNNRFKEENLKLIKAKMMAQVNKKPDSVELTELKLNQLLKKRYLFCVNFAVHHSDKEVAPYIALTQLQDAHFKLLDTINKSLSPEVKKSIYGVSLDQFVNSLVDEY